ncbi:MAG TPA: glycosyltransferase family 39 protein [Ignavibacteriaceae bacterium]|nr:glycosyltransferase family 39 protein [Ignavibacteriaceae bacterium]
MILFLAVLWRVNNISSPIMGAQSWRQADTAAMSRNYYENGFNFLYPQIDWGGNSEGYVESEFPFYQFIVALFYRLFGIHEIIGRILSVIFSIVTILVLFKTVSKYIDEKTALWTCFIYSILPINVFYSRVFMPEPLLLMSISLGLYSFSEWLDKQKPIFYFISVFFICLACLIKIPTLYIGLPLAYLAWKKYGKNVFKNIPIICYSAAVFISVFLWYYHAHQIYQKSNLSFEIWGYGSDKWGNWDFICTWEYWNGVFFKNIAEKHLTWTGFIIFILGLILFRKNIKIKLFYLWLLAGFIYLIIVAKGNYYHDYYQLPIILPISVFIGKVFSDYLRINLSNWQSKFLGIAFVITMVLSIFRYVDYIKREDPQKAEKYKLALIAKKIVPENSLVIAVSNYDPMLLYNSHKKGWQCSPGDIYIGFIKDKIKKKADYLLMNQKDFTDKFLLNNIVSTYKTEVYNDGECLIIKLD